MNKNGIKEYDFIRVMATLLVIIGHAGYLSMKTKYGEFILDIDKTILSQTLINLIIRFIYSFHMPLFFALSGSIFKLSLSLGKIKSLNQFLRYKIKRLIIPFYIVSIFYLIPIKYFTGYFNLSQNKLYDIILGQFFLCGNTHLWFLLVLFQITIIAYFLEKITLKWLKLLIIIFLFYLGNFIKIEFLGISKTFMNIIWFYIGIVYQTKYLYLKKHIIKCKNLYLKIAILFETIILAIYLLLFKNNVFFYVIINFSGIFLCLICSYYCINTNLIDTKLYKIILKNSFIIYLLSDPLNYLILYIIKKYNYYSILSNNVGYIIVFNIRIIITTFLPIIVRKIFKIFIIKKEKDG